jgi:hypothetical protein
MWIQAFQAAIETAILDKDCAQIPEKVACAKQAILHRIEDLHGEHADSEHYELRTALQTLGELASSSGPATHDC